MLGRAIIHYKSMKQRPFLRMGVGSILSIALILIFMSTPNVIGHGININVWVEGDRVVTESYFSRENKVIEGQIKVYGPSQKLLLEGKTDEKGLFSFKIPQDTDLQIVLESAMGHRAETVLNADVIKQKSVIRPQKERGPSILKVLLGIGVIFGLMFLTLYLRNRKGRSKTSP